MSKLPGNLTISRVQSSHEDDYMEIRVVDESSHVQFVSVKVGIKTFMDALTGRAHQPCEFELRKPELVGMAKEGKSLLVPKPQWNATEEDIDGILAPFEVEGWIATRENIKNNHNYRGDKVQVNFHRFVNPKE